MQGIPVEAGLPRSWHYEGKTVALVSWRFLLATILTGLEQAGEPSIAADVRQLVALCERMDSGRFFRSAMKS